MGVGGARIVGKVLFFSLEMKNRLLGECLLSDRILWEEH